MNHTTLKSRAKLFYAEKIQEKGKLASIRVTNWIYFKSSAILIRLAAIARSILVKLLPNSIYQSIARFSWILRRKHFPPRPGVRWYLKRNLDIASFFEALKNNDVNYIVLRWFDDLPECLEGEDIDILVADEQLSFIRNYCDQYNNGGQKLDIYSVTGILGSSYLGAPYYPVKLAEQLIDSKRLHKNIFYIPSEEEYFLSLAYHAVFHKGKSSGLHNKNNHDYHANPEHDYVNILKSIATRLELEVEDYSLQGVHCYLESKGWTPELDTLRLYARNDNWLNELANNAVPIKKELNGELAVFIIRKWALDNGWLEFILDHLKSRNFDILKVYNLNTISDLQNANNKIRGGEWGNGPYPKCGGDPYAAIACFDYSPVTPSDEIQKIYPHLSNANLLVKHEIRKLINRDTLFFKQTNCIHSADDEVEAWQYLKICSPELHDEIALQVNKIRSSGYFHNREVLEVFVPNGTRAKTELIKFNNELAVLKSFKPECERFFLRETMAYSLFSQKIDTIPPLLEQGDHYIIVKYYNNILDTMSESDQKKEIKKHTTQILKTLKLFYNNGYAILGFYPGNIIITSENELKIIDFEFMYKYETSPKSFSLSYDLAGVPAGFSGDMPRGNSNHTLENTWEGYLDMSIVKSFFKNIPTDI